MSDQEKQKSGRSQWGCFWAAEALLAIYVGGFVILFKYPGLVPDGFPDGPIGSVLRLLYAPMIAIAFLLNLLVPFK